MTVAVFFAHIHTHFLVSLWVIAEGQWCERDGLCSGGRGAEGEGAEPVGRAAAVPVRAGRVEARVQPHGHPHRCCAVLLPAVRRRRLEELVVLCVLRGRGMLAIVRDVADTELFGWKEVAGVVAQRERMTIPRPVLEGRVLR
ncbi:putative elongation factor 1-gamma (EF-1-gamma) [Trypanosoma cruzi]|nr:putative elongation factor 1-gamma (EF-1-gamma) [Trypanosoma cruzi]